jgi:hypothetical protein
MLKAPGTKRLKQRYDDPPSNFAFKCNLRRYKSAFNAKCVHDGPVAGGGGLDAPRDLNAGPAR